jgi:hypothetical protein
MSRALMTAALSLGLYGAGIADPSVAPRQAASSPPSFSPTAPPGTIEITLDVSPDAPDDVSFRGTGGLHSFNLDDDPNSPTMPNTASFLVKPGTYTITQVTFPPALGNGRIACFNTVGSSSTYSADYPKVKIHVESGETVNCFWYLSPVQ